MLAASTPTPTRSCGGSIPGSKTGMNNELERTTGCFACHGTRVEVSGGRPDPGTWPNVGIGRINPDGSRGSCSSCHTRHLFSLVEARKPEACDQCHLGPDHPQIEIYNESKHGTIYNAEGQPPGNGTPDDRRWTAGRDFRAPTCTFCHMSAASTVARTHDVTERLAWELQAPLTVRPQDFAPSAGGLHLAGRTGQDGRRLPPVPRRNLGEGPLRQPRRHGGPLQRHLLPPGPDPDGRPLRSRPPVGRTVLRRAAGVGILRAVAP